MQIRRPADTIRTRTLDPVSLREHFLMDDLFAPGEIVLHYVDSDRAVCGSAVPTGATLVLKGDPIIHAETLCENRELGVLNIGQAGTVSADGETYTMETGDCLYLGRGTGNISFASNNAKTPAEFYLLSYPAQVKHPAKQVRKSEATPVHLGESETANKRTIYKMIHPGAMPTCQLVMGYTELEAGNVWNTMPCHTHERRSEIYLYHGLPDNGAVMHFMGEPEHTRHMVVRNKQAIISPAWSIHSGCGTCAYSFVWGMGGENQVFDDMDWVDMQKLR